MIALTYYVFKKCILPGIKEAVEMKRDVLIRKHIIELTLNTIKISLT